MATVKRPADSVATVKRPEDSVVTVKRPVVVSGATVKRPADSVATVPNRASSNTSHSAKATTKAQVMATVTRSMELIVAR